MPRHTTKERHLLTKPAFWATNFLTPAVCVGLFWLLLAQYNTRLQAAEQKADSVSKVVQQIEVGQARTETMLTALLMKQGITVTPQSVAPRDSTQIPRRPIIVYLSKHKPGEAVRVTGDTIFIPWDSTKSAGNTNPSVTPR